MFCETFNFAIDKLACTEYSFTDQLDDLYHLINCILIATITDSLGHSDCVGLRPLQMLL